MIFRAYQKKPTPVQEPKEARRAHPLRRYAPLTGALAAFVAGALAVSCAQPETIPPSSASPASAALSPRSEAVHPEKERVLETSPGEEIPMQTQSPAPAFHTELKVSPAVVRAGESAALSFTVRDSAGEVVRSLPLVHEKPMHLIVVSRDLSVFAHLHPEPQPDGSYLATHTFPEGGAYKLYADYTPQGASQIVDSFELRVEGHEPSGSSLEAEALPAVKSVDGLRVTMSAPAPLRADEETMLSFSLSDTRTGEPVTDLEPYLGAFAHFIILSEDTRDFLHAHPVVLSSEGEAPEHAHTGGHTHAHGAHADGRSASVLGAHTTFPRGGVYKVWAQFQRDGKVITVPFVVQVVEG